MSLKQSVSYFDFSDTFQWSQRLSSSSYVTVDTESPENVPALNLSKCYFKGTEY